MVKDLYFENVKINQEEVDEKKTILMSKPRRLMAILTTMCNISCIMCVKTRKTKDFTLPEKAVKRMVDFFPYLESVAWQGGEVFLVDYFKELFQEAMRYPRLIQEINTNGLLFDEEWMDIIRRANTRLIFSIDSIDKKIYEYIRKGARFEKLMENIESICRMEKTSDDLKLKKTINIVIMRSNYRTLGSFIDFALRYNFAGLNFLNMINVGDNSPQEDIFSPPDIEAMDYLKKALPPIIKRAESCGISVSCNITTLLREGRSPNSAPEPSNRDRLFCVMPWKSLCIDASRYGEVFPECLCHRPVGNICKNSLDEIWNNELMQVYRNKIRTHDLENWCNPDCIKELVNKTFLQTA